ncbi:hypothetical protein [Streptomyces bacillaris]|uniref:hypothetical protein n=1 Tax=Streptomyces bacillaris TaxID=68179 RepID=UPI00364582D6
MGRTVNEWVPSGPLTEPVYDRADPQSGRALVDFHLRELGLGEVWMVRVGEDGLRYGRDVRPLGPGVCRTEVLTEAAWPDGAELCVLVSWAPDEPYRREYRTGRVPAGAEEHWRERIEVVARALRTRGYVVEPSRVVCSPRHDSAAELLVYRMPEGLPPRPTPRGQPLRRTSWRYPERSPIDLVRDALHDAGLPTDRQGARSPVGRIGIRLISQTVWPPEADRCTWVTWWPDDDFARDPDTGLLPAGAEEHWRECLGQLRQALTAAGLALRPGTEAHQHPDVRETADFLVYRVACAPSPTERTRS